MIVADRAECREDGSMNANDAVAILRKHNEWRRAESPEIPDDMPDMPSACSAREIGVAIDVLCDEIERLRARPIPARDEIIKLWELAMLETTSGLDAIEYFARAILRPNADRKRVV